MKYEHLAWDDEGSEVAYSCRVFTVRDQRGRAPDGRTGRFSILDASDWAIVVPLFKDERGDHFVMVRQWRHGSKEISIEFPGGVIEKGETPLEAAARELAEETGWAAGTLRELGSMSPNPAIMSNKVHFFAAENLRKLEKQKLDDDEFVDVELVPVQEVRAAMGRPPHTHALMAAALALYFRPEESGE